MGGTSHVLCKYYLHGACKFGADCAFSHDLKDAETQVRPGLRECVGRCANRSRRSGHSNVHPLALMACACQPT
jgi:hypothetical protein